MSSDAIIYVIVFIVAVILLAVVVPTQEDKKRAETEAGRITKYFGNTPISLFHFPGGEGSYGKSGYYVLVEFNSRFDDIYAIAKHKNHYEVGYWTEKGANKRKEVEKDMARVLKLLPYSISRFEAPISYPDYKEAVQTVDGSYLMGTFSF